MSSDAAPARAAVAVRLRDGWQAHVPAAWRDGWQPQRFELADGSTEVIAVGSGPPLVLLPPLPGYKEAWLACAAPLAREFRVITMDLRTRFTGPPKWEALLDDLSRVLDAFAPGRAGVVGHSLGGALAQRWAIAHPDRVSALVLSSSFARVLNPRGNRWARFVEQPLVLAGQRLLPEALAAPLASRLARRGAWVYDTRCDAHVLGLVRHCIRDLPLGSARAAVALALAHDTRAALAGVSAPTLIVMGEHENPFYRDAMAELKLLMPHARSAISPGTSHLHLLSHPEWLVDQIANWMRRFAA